jgi:hypothetical protein
MELHRAHEELIPGDGQTRAMDEAPIVSDSIGLYTERSISTHASAPMSRLTVAAFAAFTLIFFAAPAFAADPQPDPDLPSVDRSAYWHLVTGKRELPSVKEHCIGGGRNAICALATMIACFVNIDDSKTGPKFCARATGDPNAFTWYGIDPNHYYVEPDMMMFRITSVERLHTTGQVVALKDSSHRLEPRDVAIGTRLKECHFDTFAHSFANAIFYCGFYKYEDFTFYLRQTGDRWWVINYEPGRSLY